MLYFESRRRTCKTNLFLSSPPSVSSRQHPSGVLSRVAETADTLAQNNSILLAKSVTKKLDHNTVIEVVRSNMAQKGTITVEKSGEIFSTVAGDKGLLAVMLNANHNLSVYENFHHSNPSFFSLLDRPLHFNSLWNQLPLRKDSASTLRENVNHFCNNEIDSPKPFLSISTIGWPLNKWLT